MSWNTSIQINKLYQAYLSLSTTALTNPMIANLNMASFNINNVNTINATSGSALTLSADASQGITINTKVQIPNYPLVITNNTANDSLQVSDATGDTTIFRIDNNGNVGIKANPSASLTGHALNVYGNGNFTGHINVPTQALGTNDTTVATTAFVLANGGGGASQISTFDFFRPLFPTNFKESIIFNASSTTITNTSIDAQLDGLPDHPQYISYGASIPNLYVAGGRGTVNTLAVSADGINWQGLRNTVFSTGGYGVAYSGSRWVAVGEGTNQIAWSDNPLNGWNPVGAGLFTVHGRCVFFTGTRWLAGGQSTASTLAYSTDSTATSWVGLGRTTFFNEVFAFASNGEIIIAGGGATTNNLAYSYDGGITWTGLGMLIADNACKALVWDGQKFVAQFQVLATGATMGYSYNGITWFPTTSPPFDIEGTGLVWNNQVMIATGSHTAGSPSLSYSQDGQNWNSLATTFSYGNAVAWSGSLFIVCGTSASVGGDTILYSRDGQSWSGASAVLDLEANCVAFNSERPNRITFPVNTVVLGGALTNTLSYSTNNGVSWKNVGATIFSTQTYGLAYGNGKFVGFGQGGNTLAYSYNGKHWIGNGFAIFTSSGRGGVYSSVANRWVGVGGGLNSIADSVDGITWSGQGTALMTTGLAVGYGAGYFVVGGQGGSNTIAYSTTGTAFSGAGATVFTGSCRAVAHNGTRFALGGSGGASLATSDDGTTFTAVAGSTTLITTVNGMAWNGSIFLACGSGANVFVSSPDGLTWSGLGGSSVFATTGNEVIWIGNKWIAVGTSGAGGTTVAISTDATATSWIIPAQTQFGSTGLAGAWNGVSGSAIIPSTSITLNSTNNKKLDVITAPYGNNGYNNITMTVKG
jgi:hypothetical protein